MAQRSRDRGRQAKWLTEHLATVHGVRHPSVYLAALLNFHDGNHGFHGVLLDPQSEQFIEGPGYHNHIGWPER